MSLSPWRPIFVDRAIAIASTLATIMVRDHQLLVEARVDKIVRYKYGPIC